MLLIVAGGIVEAVQAPREPKLVFLTREGCVNTATMRAHLDEALRKLGLPSNYAVIDADALKPSDRRRGYGTPTLLFNGRDLFGQSEPKPPLPAPT